MNRLVLIIGSLIVILAIVFLYIKNNIQNNIYGEIKSIKLKNLKDFLVPKIDLDVSFEMVNKSKFNLNVKNLDVKIYDNLTKKFLTENKVKLNLTIPKGISTHNIVLNDNEILGNTENFLSGNVNLLVLISFYAYGTRIEFEQNVKL